MDTTQSFKDTENSLRDFIHAMLIKDLGDNWEEKCGISELRLNQWKERKKIETKRQDFGTVETRLIYYADFYDLGTILKKNWSNSFSKVFGQLKEMELLLGILEKYRDVDAHRRELLTFQKHLILGISGEIRSKIIKYRSMDETGKEYFPRFESVRDNFGNIWTFGNEKAVHTDTILKPDDDLEFIVTGFDPDGLPIEYIINGLTNWQFENVLNYRIQKKDIALKKGFSIRLKSPREYHANGVFDDVVFFYYKILPSKK